MKRREALQAMGALGAMAFGSEVAAASKSAVQSPPKKIALGDDFFLSNTNPTATVDQRDLEAQALSVMQHPRIRDAREQAARRFKILNGSQKIPDQGIVKFEDQMDEWTFHYVLLAMNSDPNYPKVLHHDYGPPHDWFGMKVPGGRGPGTAENVDNAYSVIPIAPYTRYELHGQRQPNPTIDCPLHIVGNISMSMNISQLGIRDTAFKPDGSFVVTIGPEPANGRRNHLQTSADSRYLFIRDARADWRQIPSAFRIHRLDPPLAPPMPLDEKIAIAARFVIDDVTMNHWFKQMVNIVPFNTVAMPDGSQFWGGQPSQKLGRGHLNLADDEAFVMTVDPGGALYHNVILHDYWFMSLNYWDHSSTLNSTQAVANADGTYTYVFSMQDPGVHNWLDTIGLHETMFFIRFQLLPKNPDGSYSGAAKASGQVVKLKDLDSVLPASAKRVSPDERKQQLAERRAQFNLRFEV